LIHRLSAARVVADEETFFKAVMAREQLQSTGIGAGVAIPHARSEGIRRLTVVLGRSDKGVNFSALDGKPVQLIFLVAAPQDAAGVYIQTVAKVARLVKSQTYMEKLLEAKSPEEVSEIINGFDRQHPGVVRVKKSEDCRVIHP